MAGRINSMQPLSTVFRAAAGILQPILERSRHEANYGACQPIFLPDAVAQTQAAGGKSLPVNEEALGAPMTRRSPWVPCVMSLSCPEL
ncbi:hypothetical protein CKAH01_01724 [Colletotrichum kahawae]|uniref:Uncharacterized protein n=1 Tax=Colletotrichum kahawae TaxID=34407 RepID=A0AAE0D0V9_COLKA|nr:hypothetical protein CKAH01_01724 [Colletotrichum kahawae]